jgi:NAD-dependent deacetylase
VEFEHGSIGRAGNSRRAVVFTGAGISTESGIPDYRSPGEIWSKFRPIDCKEFMTSKEARREYWQRKFDTHGTVMQAKPNRGHLAIAKLVRLGKVTAVITQNGTGCISNQVFREPRLSISMATRRMRTA